jgi:integrase
MGSVRRRVEQDGRVRYLALYRDLRGRQVSAGTFSSKREAAKAWQRAEVELAQGRVGDRRRGLQTFERYLTIEWLPTQVIEASTRESYTYQIEKHIRPWFGPMRMAEILPAHVREWVVHLQGWRNRKTGRSLSPKTIENLHSLLSGIFTTALNDQVIVLHPCKGVKTPTVPRKALKVITPEQFELIYQALPDGDSRLLVELAIESGMRWGELTELRPRDIDLSTRIMTVSRAVAEVRPAFHPTGGRFIAKDYPKDRESRRFKLSSTIVARLREHIRARGLGPDDLLFAMPSPGTRHIRVAPNPDELGLTEPTADGRQYRHGTLTAYTMGCCRCRPCKDAMAIYRAARRAAGRDNPRPPRVRDTDGHIPRNWFRTQVWKPALTTAGLDFNVRMHDLRHAHASWLLAGGADLQVVKERLGHASIATTERYLHTLPDADDTALDALAKIRGRVGRVSR